MGQPQSVPFNRNSQHSDPHRPGGCADRQLDILIVSLSVLSHQTAVHNVVNRSDHFLIASPLLQDYQETFQVRVRLVVPVKTSTSLALQALGRILLFQYLAPIPQNLVNPQENFIANILVRVVFLALDHDHLLRYIRGIVSQPRLNHPRPVFGIELHKLLFLFDLQLKFLVVDFHIVFWILEMKIFDLFKSLIAGLLCLAEQSYRLMQLPQPFLDFMGFNGRLLSLLLLFDHLAPYIVLVVILQLFFSLCLSELLLQPLLCLPFLGLLFLLCVELSIVDSQPLGFSLLKYLLKFVHYKLFNQSCYYQIQFTGNSNHFLNPSNSNQNCLKYQADDSDFKTCTVLLLLQTALAQEGDQVVTRDLSDSQIWGFGILAGFGVAMIGFFAAALLISFKRCMDQSNFTFLVNTFYALGCGALIGNAMIQIIPQAFQSQAVNHKLVSLVFILSVVFFLLLERSFEAFGISHSHWEGQGGQGAHAHDHKDTPNQAQISVDAERQRVESIPISNSASAAGVPAIESAEIILVELKSGPQDQVTKDKSCWANLKGKGAAGYLNLLSSLIHNFIDGFIIGVAFATGNRATYVPLVIAIFAHQIPREMGDVAIMLKNNFSGIQTILCNGFVNTVSILGAIIGLAVGRISEQINIYVLVTVAGNFIYIGADIWRNLFKNKTAIRNIVEFIGISIGVGSIYLASLTQSAS